MNWGLALWSAALAAMILSLFAVLLGLGIVAGVALGALDLLLLAVAAVFLLLGGGGIYLTYSWFTAAV